MSLRIALLLGVWVFVSALVSWAVGSFIRAGSGEKAPSDGDTHHVISPPSR